MRFCVTAATKRTELRLGSSLSLEVRFEYLASLSLVRKCTRIQTLGLAISFKWFWRRHSDSMHHRDARTRPTALVPSSVEPAKNYEKIQPCWLRDRRQTAARTERGFSWVASPDKRGPPPTASLDRRTLAPSLSTTSTRFSSCPYDPSRPTTLSCGAPLASPRELQPSYLSPPNVWPSSERESTRGREARTRYV